MKLCMVTTFYPPYHFGGDATYVHRLAAELDAAGTPWTSCTTSMPTTSCIRANRRSTTLR